METGICIDEKEIKRDTKEFLRYFICSVLSLILDIGAFSASIRFLDVHWMYAACIGFIIGSTVSYLGSIYWVFQSRKMATHQNTEFFLFVTIGVCGLILCEFLLWLGITVMGFAPEVTRAFASVITFFFNFMVRKIALFRG
ncbi:MAG: GtrA family protein [Acetobacter orientalis]|uniref:GtrA family protein n=1 Tax=Acetobacter orientalis TaxID=146474 RepID=UPI0039EA2B83